MKKTKKERWVWGCGFDNLTWEDGYRCYACSKKPVATEEAAQKALDKHCRTCTTEGQHFGQVWKLGKGERFIK